MRKGSCPASGGSCGHYHGDEVGKDKLLNPDADQADGVEDPADGNEPLRHREGSITRDQVREADSEGKEQKQMACQRTKLSQGELGLDDNGDETRDP